MLENVLILVVGEKLVAMSGYPFGKFMLLILVSFIVCVVFVVFVVFVLIAFYIIRSIASKRNSCEEKSYVATYMQKRAIECAGVCVVCIVIAFLLMLLWGVYGIVEGKI